MYNESLFDKTYKIDYPEDFLPFAIHIDSQTLLTKNGSVIQTLEFKHIANIGLSSNKILELLRQSIIKNIKGKEIAVWIHTLHHTKKKFLSSFSHKHKFQKEVCDLINNTSCIYTNSIYISLVHLPLKNNITGLNAFLNSFFPSIVDDIHNNYISKSKTLISNTILDLCNDLKHLNPKILSLIKDTNGMKSEQLSLFRYITAYDNQALYIMDQPLHKYFFSGYQYEISRDQIHLTKTESKQVIYSTCLSLREPYTLPSNIIDEILNQKIGMICTEVIIPSSQQFLQQHCQFQKDIASTHEDRDLYLAKNYDNFFEKDGYEFLSQNTVAFISKSQSKILTSMEKYSATLGNIGVVSVLETINLEAIFWSQIPGNFHLLKRLKPGKNDIGHFLGFGVENIGLTGNFKTTISFLQGIDCWYRYNFFDFQNNTSTCLYGISALHHNIYLQYLLMESLPITDKIMYIGFNDNLNQRFNEFKVIDKKYKSLTLPNPLSIKHVSILQDFFQDIFIAMEIPLTKTDDKILQGFINYIIKSKSYIFKTLVKNFTKGKKLSKNIKAVFEKLNHSALSNMLNSKEVIDFTILKTSTYFCYVNFMKVLKSFSLSSLDNNHQFLHSCKRSYINWLVNIFIHYSIIKKDFITKASSNMTGIIVLENLTKLLDYDHPDSKVFIQKFVTKLKQHKLVVLTSLPLNPSKECVTFLNIIKPIFKTSIIFNNNEENIFLSYKFHMQTDDRKLIMKFSKKKNIVISQNQKFYILDIQFANLLNKTWSGT